MSFVSGPYAWTLGGASLGIIEQPMQLELQLGGQTIIGDNLGAQTIQDYLYEGATPFWSMVLQEFDAAAALTAFWPWAAAFGEHGDIAGQRASAVALTLVGTAIGGIAAPATITAQSAVLAPNFPIQTLYGHRHRNVPIRFLILPYTDVSDSNKTKWWV